MKHRVKPFKVNNIPVYRIQERKFFLGFIPYWTETTSTRIYRAYVSKETAENDMRKL